MWRGGACGTLLYIKLAAVASQTQLRSALFRTNRVFRKIKLALLYSLINDEWLQYESEEVMAVRESLSSAAFNHCKYILSAKTMLISVNTKSRKKKSRNLALRHENYSIYKQILKIKYLKKEITLHEKKNCSYKQMKEERGKKYLLFQVKFIAEIAFTFSLEFEPSSWPVMRNLLQCYQ